MGFDIRIRRSDSGDKVLASLYNITQLLRHHPVFKGRSYYDSFAESVRWEDAVGDWGEITDHDVDMIRYVCQDRWSVNFKKDDIFAAVEIVAKENKKNPIHDYFDSIRGKWKPGDEPRAERLLIDYFGAEDTPINKAYSLRWLISVAARTYATVRKPIKADAMLVLYGGQGIGKSTALRCLCFSSVLSGQYFGDSELSMDNYRESVQAIQGKAIYELQELAKRTKDVRVEKAFLSRDYDDVRLPYKRSYQKFARKTIFCATTNKKNVLNDASGSRRFWCVDLGRKKIDICKLRQDLDLIWSEVLYHYEAGEQHYLTDEEEQLRVSSAADFTDPHPLEDAVLDAVSLLSPPYTVSQILEHIYKDPDPTRYSIKHLDKSTRQNQAIISDILLSNNFVYARRKKHENASKRLRGWWPS
tara:strand:+ start:24810 stop:26054 length:1245 start_codon:yes stop_codon:yes gene_type:complete